MSTSEAFIIDYGNYNEETDENSDVLMTWDGDSLSMEPPLTGCSITDILELAEWLTGKKEE